MKFIGKLYERIGVRIRELIFYVVLIMPTFGVPGWGAPQVRPICQILVRVEKFGKCHPFGEACAPSQIELLGRSTLRLTIPEGNSRTSPNNFSYSLSSYSKLMRSFLLDERFEFILLKCWTTMDRFSIKHQTVAVPQIQYPGRQSVKFGAWASDDWIKWPEANCCAYKVPGEALIYIHHRFHIVDHGELKLRPSVFRYETIPHTLSRKSVELFSAAGPMTERRKNGSTGRTVYTALITSFVCGSAQGWAF